MQSLPPCPECGQVRRGLLTIVGTPRPQGSLKVIPFKGRHIAVHASSKMKAWREYVEEEARRLWDEPPLDGPVRVDRYFVMPAPKTRPAPRAPNRELPAVKPDIDKLDRALLDALTGVCWVDDARIVGGQCWEVYGTPPRVVFYAVAVTLEEVLEQLPFRPSP